MKFIDGGLSVDDRGIVTFVNDFDFKDVKRFYMVQNHAKGFIRAWHGHLKEGKYVLVVKGTIMLATIELNDRGTPIGVPVAGILTDQKPAILYIPPRQANGFKTLTDDARVMFFSTTTLEESEGDDIRFPARKWDIWQEDYR